VGILFITSDYCKIEAPLDGGGEDCARNSFPGFPTDCKKRKEVRAKREEAVTKAKEKEAKEKVRVVAGYHAVVCYGYWDIDGELRILVLDNHTDQGPSRWVDFRAFHSFITLTADQPSPYPPHPTADDVSPESNTRKRLPHKGKREPHKEKRKSHKEKMKTPKKDR
jgi:hypothetical protein